MELNENIISMSAYITIFPIKQVEKNLWEGEVRITNKISDYIKGDVVYYLDNHKTDITLNEICYHLVLDHNIVFYEEKDSQSNSKKSNNKKIEIGGLFNESY